MDTIQEKRILLVDDEEDIRTVLAITLADMGYSVLEAENGEKALAVFRKERPPIVLTDIKMPCMDGIEMLKIIKQENPDTEVIMITGHGDIDIAIKSLKYEAIDFITKPISSEALEISLKRANEKILTRHLLRQYTANLENLVRQKTMLQDNLSSLGAMIGSISHSIKGLLTRLDGGLYLLSSGVEKKDPARLEEGLEILKLNIDRIKKMIFDILYYSKERRLQIETMDTLAFVHDVADIAGQKASAHGIEIQRSFEEAPERFSADPEYIRSALINVLDNAVDACVADHEKKDHRIAFAVRRDGENLVFDIHDNGIGMDPATREKIFTLLFSSKQHKGTGFGLFITKNIVQQHGGVINVHSAKGKGTLIQIRIPLQFL